MNGDSPLTLPAHSSILTLSANNNDPGMAELDIKKLEDRVDDLIKAVERLQQENKSLRESQTNLMSERSQLIEKTELARSRVEAMISRLKALENG